MIIDCSGGDLPGAQWLPAHEAYNLVCAHIGADIAAVAIAMRAHEGLIKTRAKRASFEIRTPEGGKTAHRFDNPFLPKEFWWAEGGEGLRPNWESGDFSTLNEGQFEWKAFGVSFELQGVHAMLRPTPSASVPNEAATPDETTACSTRPRPSDPEIVNKMKEMKARGWPRDKITKLICKERGFEEVTNKDARLLYGYVATRGRPPQNKHHK